MSLENPKGYGSTPDKTAYSGAFLIQSHSADSSIELVKNPNYWDADRVVLSIAGLYFMRSFPIHVFRLHQRFI